MLSSDKKIFLLLLSIIAFVADILTIYTFFEKSTFQHVWTSQWMLSVLFIFLFIAISTGLLYLASFDGLARVLLGLYSLVYLAGAVMIYVMWSTYHIIEIFSLDDYSGYLVLFALFFFSGVFMAQKAMGNEEQLLLKLFSYAFGLANITLLLLMLDKYVFLFSFTNDMFDMQLVQNNFYLWPFVGEILLALMGSIIFLNIMFSDE